MIIHKDYWTDTLIQNILNKSSVKTLVAECKMYSWTSRLLEHLSKIQETLHKVDKRSRANTTVVCVTTDTSIHGSMV